MADETVLEQAKIPLKPTPFWNGGERTPPPSCEPLPEEKTAQKTFHKVLLKFNGCHIGNQEVDVPLTIPEDDVYTTALGIIADRLGVTRDNKNRPLFGVMPEIEYLN